jgi:hypothetical protein
VLYPGKAEGAPGEQIDVVAEGQTPNVKRQTPDEKCEM